MRIPICSIAAVTALMVLLLFPSFAQRGEEDINQAVKSKRWADVERLAHEGIRHNGFHFSLGHLYVLALANQGRSQEGLAQARTWTIRINGAGGKAVLADALMSAGYYTEARNVLRDLANVRPDTQDAQNYLDGLRERGYKKTYRLTWQIGAEEAATMQEEWFAPPQDTINQRLLKLELRGVAQVDEKRDTYGNRLLKLRPLKTGPIVVTAEVQLIPLSVQEFLPRLKGSLSAEMEKYLSASRGIVTDTDEIRAVVQPFERETWTSRVIGVMNYANSRLTYCPPGSPPGIDSSKDAMRRGGGHCEALSSVIAACLRTTGVPARMIRGQSAIVGERGEMKQHTIVEYWLPGIGWVDWDHKMPHFEMRSNFVRLCSYNEVGDAAVAPGFYFQGREFKAAGVFRNGPYQYVRIARSLD